MAFNGLWPTMLVRRRLPGYEEPTAALAALIVEQDARAADMTARYQEQNFFAVKHPAVRWLRENIDQTVGAFLRHMGIDRPLSWTVFGWYNTNRYGDHHGPHTHPRSYLSSTYYVRVPPPLERTEDPRSQPACISFYDPRTAANMVTAGSDRDARASYVVRPVPGTLLMWPSPVQHQVHPNLSQEPRVTISFNVIIDPKTYWPVGKRGV